MGTAMTKTSKYQQISAFLKEAIQEGQLETGQKIPSVRQLASQFTCSKDTVQRALLDLTYQHLIYAKPQSGFYVLEQEPGRHQDLPLKFEEDRNQAFEDFRTCINETLIGRENYLFNNFSDQAGLQEVRQSIQALLEEESIYTTADQIVLTSGTQQALNILSQIDFPNKKSQILIEQPTYHRMNQLLDTQQLPYRTIERTLKGIDLENLEEIFKSGHIKFFYTIPRFHYPLGHSYSPKEKEAILQLADQYDVYLVEDDYLADLDASNAPSFHYLGRNNRVIYIKSFSTNLFSALRITSMILPKELLKPVLTYKTILDYDSNLIMQKALSLYIDNGMYLTNKKRLLARRKEEETNLKTLISQSSLLSQLTLNHDGVLVDLSHVRSLAALKHSGLPLDFFEAAYIANCPYQLVKIKSADVARVLPELSSLFKTENLV